MIDDIKLKTHNREFKEIVEKIPLLYTNILFWGLIIFICIIGLLSFIIKYPDTILVETNITSSNAPIIIHSKIVGEIEKLNFQPQDYVNKNDHIAVIKNTGNYKYITRIKERLNNKDFNAIQHDTVKPYLLGEIEPYYTKFIEGLTNYDKLLNKKSYLIEIESFKNKINNDEAVIKERKKIIDILLQQDSINTANFKKDLYLFKSGAITESEWNKSNLQYLSFKKNLKELRLIILNESSNVNELKYKIKLLQSEYDEKLSDHESYNEWNYFSLLAAIKKWEHKYIIAATAEGKLEFLRFIDENSFIETGEPIFSIIPNDNSYLGKAILPSIGSGKVKRGQEVIIRLDSYPFQEYGVLYGKVKSISTHPNKNNYLVYIDLPNGLISSQGIELFFSKNMHGQAEILTNKKRLISRIYEKLVYLLSRKKEQINNENILKNEQPIYTSN